MSVRIKLEEMYADWNYDLDAWESNVDEFAKILNNVYQTSDPWGSPVDPLPPRTAIDLAKKIFPELEVVEMDSEPEFDENKIY